MSENLSPRLAAIVYALPLKPGLRVLEIGCGPGAAAREVVRRFGHGHVLGLPIRVGAFDGRHPEAGRVAGQRIRKALVKGGRLFIDGGDPLREIALAK
jgi:hypothetical protein